MTTRVPISPDDNIRDVIVKMSEGNPGAFTVCMKIFESQAQMAIFSYAHLDDLNMRGEQIWLAYKDWAGQDLNKLLDGIDDHDQNMIDLVNEMSHGPHKASKVRDRL